MIFFFFYLRGGVVVCVKDDFDISHSQLQLSGQIQHDNCGSLRHSGISQRQDSDNGHRNITIGGKLHLRLITL